jgi:hypothetical protein
MIQYQPQTRLNQSNNWFGLKMVDFCLTIGLVSLVSKTLPHTHSFLSFLLVPLILVPVAHVRKVHRDGIFIDFLTSFLMNLFGKKVIRASTTQSYRKLRGI